MAEKEDKVLELLDQLKEKYGKFLDDTASEAGDGSGLHFDLSGNNVISGDEIYIEALYIKPEHQNKGIGKEIVDELKKLSNEINVPITLIDFSKEGVEGVSFWEQLGFYDAADTGEGDGTIYRPDTPTNVVDDVSQLEAKLRNKYKNELEDLSIGINREGMYIESIAIKPEFRGRSIGSKIIIEVTDFADKYELPIFVEPVADEGDIRRFYEQFGFTNESDLLEYPGKTDYVREPTTEIIDTPTNVVDDYITALKQEAGKFNTFDEYEKAFSMDIKRGIYYHLTDNPNFVVDLSKGATDAATGKMTPGSIMFTTDLGYWSDTTWTDRPYVAILDLSDVDESLFTQVNRGQGNEFYLNDASNVKVKEVIPVDEALERSELISQWGLDNLKNKEDLKNIIWDNRPDTPTNVVDDVSELQDTLRNKYKNQIDELYIIKRPFYDPYKEINTQNGIFVEEIVIKPEFRGSGIGTEIVDEIKQFATENNYGIELEPVRGESQVTRFWENRGFVLQEYFDEAGNLITDNKELNNVYKWVPYNTDDYKAVGAMTGTIIDTPTGLSQDPGAAAIDEIAFQNTQLIDNLPIEQVVKDRWKNMVTKRYRNLVTPGGLLDAVDVWEFGVMGLMMLSIAYKDFDEAAKIFSRTATNMFNNMTAPYNIPPVPLEQYDLDYEFMNKVLETGEKVMPTDILIKKVGDVVKGVGETGTVTGFGYVPTTPEKTDTMETTQKIQPGVQEEKMFKKKRPKKSAGGGSGVKIL